MKEARKEAKERHEQERRQKIVEARKRLNEQEARRRQVAQARKKPHAGSKKNYNR